LARHGAYYCLYARDYKAPDLLLAAAARHVMPDIAAMPIAHPQQMIFHAPGDGRRAQATGNRNAG
jgi:hypothetical protein